MDRGELLQILRREGIDEGSYWLDGGHPSERHVLASQPGGWAVYYSERGFESGRRDFITEDEACRHLLDVLREDRTVHFQLVVGPLPREEADKAFGDWKRSNGLEGLKEGDVRVDDPIQSQGRVRRYWVRGTILRAILGQ